MSPIFHIGLLVMSLVLIQSGAILVEDNILLQTSAGLNSCTNTSVFSNLYWEKFPVLGALCNIKVPSIQEASLLLNYGVAPVLCMGFYETSSMLCKSPFNSLLNEVFPSTSEKMKNLTETIAKQNDYASLTKFCKSTVKNFTTTYSFTGNDSVGAPWHDILQHELKVENNCTRICGTTGIDRVNVHPLCSFIVWSYNEVSQHTPHNQKLENEEIIPIAGGDNKVNMSTATAVTELKIPAPTQKTDSATAGPASPPVESNRPPVDTQNSDKEEQSVKAESAMPVPPQQPDTVADKSDKPVDVSKGSPRASSDKKTDAVVTTKTDPSNTGSKVEVNSKADVVKKGEKLSPEEESKDEKSNVDVVNKAPTKESAAAEQPSIDANQDVDQTGVERPNVLDNTADEEVHPPAPQDDVDPEGEADVDVRGGGGGGVEEERESEAILGAEDHLNSRDGLPDSQKSPSDTASKDDIVVMTDNFIEPEDPHFFTYFLFMSVLTILAYLAFHNKNKLLALAVEGRRTRGTRRRPNSSNYSKLHCSLEEAMSSKSTASVTHVLY